MNNFLLPITIEVELSPSIYKIFFRFSFPSTLREKCLYSKFFWSVFSRIPTEYREITRLFTVVFQNVQRKLEISQNGGNVPK